MPYRELSNLSWQLKIWEYSHCRRQAAVTLILKAGKSGEISFTTCVIIYISSLHNVL